MNPLNRPRMAASSFEPVSRGSQQRTVGLDMNVKGLIEVLSTDSTWESLREARKFLRGPVTRMDCNALHRFLSGAGPSRRADFAARRVRIAVASDTSLDNIAEPLSIRLLDRGMFGVIYQSSFGQFAHDFRQPGSELLGHEPDVLVLAPLTEVLLLTDDTTKSEVERTVDEVWSHVSAVRDRFGGLLLLQNMTTPESRPHGILDARSELGRADFARSVNLHLSQRCRETGLAHVLDAQFLEGQSGTVWPGLHKQYMMAGRPLSDELVSLLALDVAAFCAALKGFTRKCVAVDLDNTLWGGVVGEDGAARVTIGGGYPGNVFAALQAEIQKLRKRGIILTVLSKNNEADAWEVFDQRPEMVLRRSDFSACRINWLDKCTNLRNIASELCLGLDAFVVLDDNPVERAWIEETLPEVEVCPAADPLEMLRWLTTCRRFDTMAITKEDALRARSYAAASLRSESARNVQDLGAYLEGLGMVVEVGAGTMAHLARVAQLTQKTNQFNLTTRRYTDTSVQDLMSAGNWRVLWCTYRDRFADEGVIGAALVKIENSSWLLDTFLMSCRVLGRGVEKAFLDAICDLAARQGAVAIVGEYVRTAKNSQAETFFESCGFTAKERTSEHSLWQSSIPPNNELTPRWITLKCEAPVSTVAAGL